MSVVEPTAYPSPLLLFATNCYIKAEKTIIVKFMSNSPSPTEAPNTPEANEPQPSYVKLAMRNMVKKGRKSLTHFFLTTIALIGFFVGVSYLTR